MQSLLVLFAKRISSLKLVRRTIQLYQKSIVLIFKVCLAYRRSPLDDAQHGTAFCQLLVPFFKLAFHGSYTSRKVIYFALFTLRIVTALFSGGTQPEKLSIFLLQSRLDCLERFSGCLPLCRHCLLNRLQSVTARLLQVLKHGFRIAYFLLQFVDHRIGFKHIGTVSLLSCSVIGVKLVRRASQRRHFLTQLIDDGVAAYIVSSSQLILRFDCDLRLNNVAA